VPYLGLAVLRFERGPPLGRSLGPGQAVLWELCMILKQVTLREVELTPSHVLRIFEHSELADCAGVLRHSKARAHAVAVSALLTGTCCGAGAVVWDAALVLVHYLARTAQGARAVCCIATCIL